MMSLRWGDSPMEGASTPMGESVLIEALTLWPKLAEYAGLSEYEAKIYAS